MATRQTNHTPEYLNQCYFRRLYQSDRSDMIDYLENSGIQALKESRDVYVKLYEDARKTLTFILAGVGISFGYAFKLIIDAGHISAYTLGISLACTWLCICALILLSKCINSHHVPVLYISPKHLYTQDGKDVDIDLRALRLFHLEGLNDKIAAHYAVNRRVVKWLDRVRYMIAATPAVALIGYLSGFLFLSS